MGSVLRLSLLALLPFFAMACGGTELELDDRTEDEPLDDGSNLLDQGLVSCTPRSAVGYTSGRATAITVVTADARPAEIGTANAYSLMQAEAARSGVHLRVVSGYRTQAEQSYLYSCYVNCSCNGCNLAARPGYSNHQSGKALDLNTRDPGVYTWLTNNAARFGFRRTVPSEIWHWEYFGGVSGGACAGGTSSGGNGRSDLVVVQRVGGSNTTELHSLEADSKFSTFAVHAASGLHTTDYRTQAYDFAAGDFDGDRKPDLYGFRRSGANNSTEVHILTGASGYKRFGLQATTAMHATGHLRDRIEFRTGDYDGDNRSDIYVIHRVGGSGKTEVHVLSAASNFQKFILHAATGLHSTFGKNTYEFQTGDFDRDNKSDLYVFKRDGANAKTEVHILSAASGFKHFAKQIGTGLHSTANAPTYDLRTGDFDNDGRTDIYVVRRDGAGAMSEVHVLSAASNFQRFVLNVKSALAATANDPNFEFHGTH